MFSFLWLNNPVGQVTASAEGDDDWPMFQHDLTRSGYSTSTAPNTNHTLWNYSNGDIYSGELFSIPVVAGGKVYVGSWDKNVYCLNAATGVLIWNYTTGDYVSSCPAVINGRVYVGSNDKDVYCLNAETGIRIWNYTTGGKVYYFPAVVDGKVYIDSSDNKTYALDAITGEYIWSYSGNMSSSPTVADGRVYIGSYDNKIYCLNATTGAHIWNYTTGDDVYASPAVVDGKVFVGSWDDEVYCLNALTGALIWNYTTDGNVHFSPAVADGKVYVGSNDSNVYCLNALSGTLIWNYTTGSEVWASPAVADGKVYIGSSWNTKFFCLNATTGALVWSYNAMSFMISPAAIADGKVYIAAGVNVYCFGSGDWPMFRHDPQHSGYSTAAVPGANQTPWSYSTGGAVDSSPAVVEGRVYVGSSDKNIYCLNAATGEHIWNYTTGEGVRSSPAVVDGRVYVGSNDNKVYCLNAADGAFIWNYTTGVAIGYSSPVVADGKVYVGSGDGKLHCINATTGALVWDYTTGNCFVSSPAVADNKVYVGSADDGRVYCLNAVTGELIWSDGNYFGVSDWYSSPAIADGKVYIGSTNFGIPYYNCYVFCLNATTGEKTWMNYTTGDINELTYSSLAVADGKVYIGSTYSDSQRNGKVVGLVSCFDATTGTGIWSYSTDGAVDSSPAVADGKVYVGSNDGRVYCLNASTGDFIWNEIINAGFSSPAVVDGIIYIGSNNGKVYCLNPAIGGWDFDDFFKLDGLRIVYPSAETLKPLGCSAAMVSDWTASAFISTKLENAAEGLDTDSAFVNQASGRPTGAIGTGVVSFGGPLVNLVVAYAESASTQTEDRAPIRFHQESGVCYFQYSNGTSITGANLSLSVVNGNMDMFVVEVYRDGDGRYMLLCYGFGWKGTYAAGKYFDTEIYPNIGSYPYTWIIIKWEDTNGNGFVNTAAGGDTYAVIATSQG